MYMSLKDLSKKYDEMQQKYGDPELHSIYNGGCDTNPDICFVFMNPTARNIASLKNWNGKYYPWLATKNIWKLFYNIDLLDHNIYEKIQSKKPKEWDKYFADEVYENVTKQKYFITNLAKCTQIDARALPDKIYQDYLELLYKEIEIIEPKKIVTFGNQISTIFLGQKINVSKCRKQAFQKKIGKKIYDVYPVFYPVGNGMRNIDKAIEDLQYIKII